MTKLLLLVLVLLLGGVGVFVVMPSPIDAVAYTPGPGIPLTGAWAENDALRVAQRRAEGRIDGPEDLTVDAKGALYTGLADGRIVRFLDDGTVQTVANTGGRPLGLRFDARGHLLVADATRGLIDVDPTGKVEVLVDGAENVPFRCVDHLTIAKDGTVYFTDASDRWTLPEYLYDLLESRPRGRLLKYDPKTRKTTVLLRDLQFANGTALSRDERFLLVDETYRNRILRYWLKGEQAGTSDVFLDDLPGFPDNLTRSPRGTFWLAVFTVRSPLLAWLHPRPWAKNLLAKLPPALWPQAQPYGLVAEIDEEGHVLRTLHDPGGKTLHGITSALERDGVLWLGGLHVPWIAKLTLPLPSQAAPPTADAGPSP
jgi:sugar lactone lactonase YvrE